MIFLEIVISTLAYQLLKLTKRTNFKFRESLSSLLLNCSNESEAQTNRHTEKRLYFLINGKVRNVVHLTYRNTFCNSMSYILCASLGPEWELKPLSLIFIISATVHLNIVCCVCCVVVSL